MTDLSSSESEHVNVTKKLMNKISEQVTQC
jgi:hypothetical protein